MRFLYLSHDGMIDVMCCVGLRFTCTRWQFSLEGRVTNLDRMVSFRYLDECYNCSVIPEKGAYFRRRIVF